MIVYRIEQNNIIISQMKQFSQVQPNSTTYQPTFVPYTYTKPYQMKPPNVQAFMSVPNLNNPNTNININSYHHINQQQPKNITTMIKTIQQKNDSMTPTVAKKILKYEKPAFLGANKSQHHLDSNTQNSDQIIKRQQSQPDLRKTCTNIFKKIQQSNRQQPYNLRFTTHNTFKYGSVINEAKKFEEEQKNIKKVTLVNDHTNHKHKLQLPYKSMTDPKKIGPVGTGQPNFKSLNEIYSNKQRNLQKPKRNIINGFEFYKQLGKGKFGQVYLSIHIQTGFIVALKKIIKAKVIQYKMIQQFKRQIKLHSALDHPNIVKFYGFFEDAQNIYLILQYISGGTLFDYLAQKDMLSPKEAAQFLKDTIQALCYMHERSIAHRDIKPQNIVLTGQKVAKLCDFGWSALVQSSRTTYCGTFDYAPPEILQRKNYDTAVDMWCIGVLAFQLLTGRVPFQGQKRKQIMQKIISVDKTKIIYPVQIPQDAKNFIEQLVQKNPTLRPKCKDLLKHPFIGNSIKKPVQTRKQKKL